MGAAGATLGTLAGAFGALVMLSLFFASRVSYIRASLKEDTTAPERKAFTYKGIILTMVPIILSQTAFQISFTVDDLIFGNVMEAKGFSDEVISANKRAGMSKMIVSGCNKDEIIEVLEYSKKYEDVFLTIGFHPEVANYINDSDLRWLEEIINNNNKIVAIGEIGLDYHYDGYDKKTQIDIFEKQLKIAEKLKLPVVIHSRDATMDTINILKKYSLKGDIHCFSGSLETALIYINMGYYLGIGGVVTFKNSKLGDIVSKIPLSKILLETDSPYLTPTPFRGELNSSKYIPLIAKKISESLNISIDDVYEQTTNNAIELFNIK